MTDPDRLAALEARIDALETRLAARTHALEVLLAAVAGLGVDTLALIAMRDRQLVEQLLRSRRLVAQQPGVHPIAPVMVERIEMALALADGLALAGRLGPR